MGNRMPFRMARESTTMLWTIEKRNEKSQILWYLVDFCYFCRFQITFNSIFLSHFFRFIWNIEKVVQTLRVTSKMLKFWQRSLAYLILWFSPFATKTSATQILNYWSNVYMVCLLYFSSSLIFFCQAITGNFDKQQDRNRFYERNIYFRMSENFFAHKSKMIQIDFHHQIHDQK